MNKKRLTGYEITLLFSTIAYLVDKETVLSRTFPVEFIKNSYYRLNKEQKEGIVRIMKKYINIYAGQISLDWEKLGCFLDEENRETISIEDKHIECFYCWGKYYPVEAYLEFPEKELPLDEKFINI